VTLYGAVLLGVNRVTIETTAYDKILLMMKFILLFSQYNTVQGNVNKQKKRKRKEKEKKQSELKPAYTSTKRACDSLITRTHQEMR